MVLVDTSVLLNFLKGNVNNKTIILKNLLENNKKIAISEYTYLELLQGTRNNIEFMKLQDYLQEINILMLPKSLETYDNAAIMYMSCRQKGITIRSTIDVLIALTAIFYNIPLLHFDRDFDLIAQCLKDLQIL